MGRRPHLVWISGHSEGRRHGLPQRFGGDDDNSQGAKRTLERSVRFLEIHVVRKKVRKHRTAPSAGSPDGAVVLAIGALGAYRSEVV